MLQAEYENEAMDDNEGIVENEAMEVALAPSRLRSSLDSFINVACLEQFPRVGGRLPNHGQPTVVTI
ncbi:hypothetical protein BV898_06475 [Hypsibius exemplaris]|uniref:Uncharacterized protein n=1 Tax=Hypsibius exemplaris TaxID=2072580 RepID=A0A1W0WWA4_HYPEX|nr:hypothetical protein BV898_06475 [Hypsibius exemplaris]